MNSLYNKDEDVEILRLPSDAQLIIDSGDRGSSSTLLPTGGFSLPQTQPYNNFRLQRPQNMLQGGFYRLTLSEINFPYAIPNLTPTTNYIWIKLAKIGGGAPPANAGVSKIFLNNAGVKFSNGLVIAESLTSALNADTTIGTGSANAVEWLVEYLPEEFGGFFIQAGAPATLVSAKGRSSLVRERLGVLPAYSFGMYPVDPALLTLDADGVPTATSVQLPLKSLMVLMGFNYNVNLAYSCSYDNQHVSASAPLAYTQYIDIVSDKLTQYQKVRDGASRVSATNNIICRLYIADETSTPLQTGQYWDSENNEAVEYLINDVPGTSPFLIHRQFKNPKIFRWNPTTAIDWIDIKLLDDTGNLLYVPQTLVYAQEGDYVPIANFQITFKASED